MAARANIRFTSLAHHQLNHLVLKLKHMPFGDEWEDLASVVVGTSQSHIEHLRWNVFNIYNLK